MMLACEREFQKNNKSLKLAKIASFNDYQVTN